MCVCCLQLQFGSSETSKQLSNESKTNDNNANDTKWEVNVSNWFDTTTNDTNDTKEDTLAATLDWNETPHVNFSFDFEKSCNTTDEKAEDDKVQ